MRSEQCVYICGRRGGASWGWLTAVLLLAGLQMACDGERAERNEGPTPATKLTTPGESVRLQVSLFWGGGAARAWRGEFGLGQAPGGAAKVKWTWLTDFEVGDQCLVRGRLPVPQMVVPSGWRATQPAQLSEPEPPGASTLSEYENSATIETRTDKDADGLCFEVFGVPSAKVVLNFGGAAVLETTLGDLIKAPIVVSVDESGNSLLAQAIDLRRRAPEYVLIDGQRARRTSLHTHSCFSTNQMQLEPVWNSLRPFVNRIWWTDHSVGDERRIFAGDFEDAALVKSFWQSFAGNATVLRAGLDQAAHSGSHGYRLEIEAGPEQPGFGFLHQGGAAGEFNLGLCAEPVLRWAVKSLPTSKGQLSSTYAHVTLHSGRTIRYTLGPPNVPNPATDIALAEPSSEWMTFERNVLEDARRLYPQLGTDGFRRVNFGVFCPQAARAGVLFDDIELMVPEPREVVRLQAQKLAQFRNPSCLASLEQSAWTGPRKIGALFPHLTMLVPGSAPELLTGLDHAPTNAERRAFVEKIQAAGGVVGTHHMQLDQHYQDFLDGRGLGADMFEIGGAWWFVPAYSTKAERAARDAHDYPPLDEDEVYPLLVRWDRMTARGLFLTAYGAPDLHQLFEAPSYGFLNRWLTFVFADDDSPAAELRALRTGQACASEWRSDAIMRLSAEARTAGGQVVGTDRDWMGKLVVTDRDQMRVVLDLTGAIPGSTVRWIAGALVRDEPDSTGFEPPPASVVQQERVSTAEYQTHLEVDTTAGVFVRAELLNPAGQIVALSNPIAFAPYWPEQWPAGRVAVDWDGLAIERSRGMLLTDARITASDGLQIEGTVMDARAKLVIRGEARLRDLMPQAGSKLSSDELEDGTIEISGLALGPFRIALIPKAKLPVGETAELFALPRRKQLLRSIEVGRPQSEGDWKGLGFGDAVVGPLLLDELNGSYREVVRGRFRFEMEIPTGQTSWIRFTTHGYRPVTGRLEMDGVEVGHFERMQSLSFELPAAEPGATGDHRVRFDMIFDAPATPLPAGVSAMRLQRIELFGGPGALNY